MPNSQFPIANAHLPNCPIAHCQPALLQAKTHYVKGFNPSHPKVAWAVEAQANVHQKLHNYSLAIACVNEVRTLVI